MVKAFLNAGANAFAKNNDGKGPVDYALSKRMRNVLYLHEITKKMNNLGGKKKRPVIVKRPVVNVHELAKQIKHLGVKNTPKMKRSGFK